MALPWTLDPAILPGSLCRPAVFISFWTLPPTYPLATVKTFAAILAGKLTNSHSTCIGNTMAAQSQSINIAAKLCLWLWLLRSAAAASDIASVIRDSRSWSRDSVCIVRIVARFSYLLTARFRASRSGCSARRTSVVTCTAFLLLEPLAPVSVLASATCASSSSSRLLRSSTFSSSTLSSS